MSGDPNGVRLLPWAGDQGQPCLLLTDGEGIASRIADQIEAVRLGLADRVLGRARGLLAAGGAEGKELTALAGQLVDALGDALLIARARAGQGVGQEVVLPSRCRPLACSMLALPRRNLASARDARHHVRHAARSWGLPSGTVDDLESITAELAANALEHGDGPAITVVCALLPGAVSVSVTGESDGGLPAEPPQPGPEQEHGRGLLITAVLAARWGTWRSGDGLTVWAEVPFQADVHAYPASVDRRRHAGRQEDA